MLAVLALAAPLATAALAAAAPAPKTTVNEIEGEVMCPICGTLLELAESPQAKRERAYVARLVGEGKTREQIKDALVAQYGDEVLALPKATGFDLSAYLVPIVATLVAIVALVFSVARWRRAAGSPPPPDAPRTGPGAEDAARLEADLKRYDL